MNLLEEVHRLEEVLDYDTKTLRREVNRLKRLNGHNTLDKIQKQTLLDYEGRLLLADLTLKLAIWGKLDNIIEEYGYKKLSQIPMSQHKEITNKMMDTLFELKHAA
jgi:hypothetical protein